MPRSVTVKVHKPSEPSPVRTSRDSTGDSPTAKDRVKVHYTGSLIDGTVFDARATLVFPAPGQVAGEAPCNRFSGNQSAPYPWFDLGPLAVTRRACPELTAEAAYFAALDRMTLVEVTGQTLILSTPEGGEMLFIQADGG